MPGDIRNDDAERPVIPRKDRAPRLGAAPDFAVCEAGRVGTVILHQKRGNDL